MNLFYFWIGVLSAVGLWALWTYGFRDLFLDEFKFRIERLCDDLEETAQSGCLPHTSLAYTKRKATLEGLLEVASEIGFLQLALTRATQDELRKSKGPDLDPEQTKAFESLQHWTQNRLRGIDDRMTLYTLRFLLLRVPVFAATIYIIYFYRYITGRTQTIDSPAQMMKRQAYDWSIHKSSTPLAHDLVAG